MEEIDIIELKELEKIIDNCLKGNVLLNYSSNLFSESELIDQLFSIHSWSSKTRILILSFASLSAKYESYALLSLKFSIQLALCLPKNHWAYLYSILSSQKVYTLSAIKNSYVCDNLSIEFMLKILKSLNFSSNTFLSIDKVNISIIEAFLNVLGEYKGEILEDCIKFIWEKNCDDFSLEVLKGLVFEKGLKLKSGNYEIACFSESILIYRHPNKS